MVDEKAIAKIFQEIAAKEKDMAAAVPGSDFLVRIGYLAEIFLGLCSELDLGINLKKKFPTELDLGARAPGIRKNAFFFFLFIEVISQQFNNDQPLLSGLRNADEVKILVKAWENQDAIILVTNGRKELAHLRPFTRDAFIPTRHASTDPRELTPTFINYSMAQDDWDLIRRQINKLSDPQKSVGLAYLDSLLQSQSNPKGEGIVPCYSLIPLISRARQLTEKLFADLRSSFEGKYQVELQKQDKICGEVLALHRQLAEIEEAEMGANPK